MFCSYLRYVDRMALGGSGDFLHTYNYTPPVNQWIPIAVAYDGFSKKFQVFLNGSKIYTSGLTTFTKSATR